MLRIGEMVVASGRRGIVESRTESGYRVRHYMGEMLGELWHEAHHDARSVVSAGYPESEYQGRLWCASPEMEER